MARDRWLYAWGLGSVALGAASLLVPLYYVTRGGGAVGLGLLAGVGAAAGAPGAVVAGRFADRTGRGRPVVILALGVIALLMAVVPLVERPVLLVLANGVLWLAAGAAAPVLTLLVTVGHDESTWSDRFATLNVYGGWGWAGGLVLGTAWTAVGARFVAPAFAQRSLFVACAAAAAAGALLGVRWLPRDPEPTERPAEGPLARAIARSRRTGLRSATFPIGPARIYWLARTVDPRRFVERLTPSLAAYFLAVAATFVGFGAFWGPLPLFLRDLGYSSGAVFSFYLLSSLGSAACYGAVGRLSRRWNPAGLNAGALIARAVLQPGVAVLALGTTSTVTGLLATGTGFVLIGVVWAVIAVTAAIVVTRFARPAIRGQALGLYTAVSGLANGLGAVAGGWLAATDFLLAFAFSGGCVLAGFVVVVGLWRRDRTGTATALEPVGP